MLKRLISKLFYPLKVYSFKKKWREENSHNFTTIANDVRGHVAVGNYTYGVISLPFYVSNLRIGSFCSIGDRVTFIAGGEHYTDHVCTYPFYSKLLNQAEPGGTTQGDILVDDDVWIGYGATILSGVHIGQGAIIGAESIVAKDVPPYAVYAGHKVVRYRFPENVIEKLLKFDYGTLTADDFKKHKELFYREMDESFFDTELYKKHLKQQL